MSDEKIIKNKTYIQDDSLKTLAETVIKQEHLDLPAKIAYLLVEPNIQKTVAGKCMKANPELNFFSGYNYIIEFSKDLWDKLDDQRKYLLMFHELLHVFPIEKKGELEFNIRDHDIQDFSRIIEAHGIDWISDIKTIISSIYDISDLDSIKV